MRQIQAIKSVNVGGKVVALGACGAFRDAATAHVSHGRVDRLVRTVGHHGRRRVMAVIATLQGDREVVRLA